MNNFKIFMILAIIFSTILICIIKPKMHKRVLIGSSNFALVQEENYERQLAENPSTPAQTQQTKQRLQSQAGPHSQSRQSITQPNAQPQAPIQSYRKGKLIDQNVFNPQLAQAPRPQTKIGMPPPQANTISPQINPNSRHQLTPEQEEIIAWNKWRSDLENQVLKDTQISAPIGTVFRFSFTCDKYGNISNLKTWSDNSQYTPMAVKNVKPVLLGYQGQRILNFPPKSKRISTNVNGYFVTWTSTGYSTPSDFSDYERVK